MEKKPQLVEQQQELTEVLYEPPGDNPTNDNGEEVGDEEQQEPECEVEQPEAQQHAEPAT